MSKELGRDFSPAPHQFFCRRGNPKLLFVKFDCEAKTDTKHVLVIFPMIFSAIFTKQLSVDLVPPRLGVGQNAVEIENDCAKRLSHLRL